MNFVGRSNRRFGCGYGLVLWNTRVFMPLLPSFGHERGHRNPSGHLAVAIDLCEMDLAISGPPFVERLHKIVARNRNQEHWRATAVVIELGVNQRGGLFGMAACARANHVAGRVPDRDEKPVDFARGIFVDGTMPDAG